MFSLWDTLYNIFINFLGADYKEKYDTSSEGLTKGKCISESGLDLHSGLVMVPTDQLSKKTFKECVHYCMNFAPDLNHMLISYYNSFLVSDKVWYVFMNILRSHCRSISFWTFITIAYSYDRKISCSYMFY